MPDALEGWLEYWIDTHSSATYMYSKECRKYGIDPELQPYHTKQRDLVTNLVVATRLQRLTEVSSAKQP